MCRCWSVVTHLDVPQVLREHALDRSTALHDISSKAACKAHVHVLDAEDAQVTSCTNAVCPQHKDAVDDDDCSISAYYPRRYVCAAVVHKVVRRYLDVLFSAQRLEVIRKQLKVYRRRVVEVILQRGRGAKPVSSS